MSADISARLAPHYSRFRVTERILLTGHSHQAWPDAGFEAHARAWLDAAEYVDDKWPHAEAKAAQVREGFARLLGEESRNIALGQNTHELVTRWLSALPLRRRPRLVTTDGEFRSIRRQLDRLAEEDWVEVVKVAAAPAATLAERLAAHIDDRAAGALVSSVLFQTAEIVPHLDVVAVACAHAGVELLVDAYHHLNVVPFDLEGLGLAEAFVTGGGYKYCQLGEGNCFLRVPPGRLLRPVVTGWFAELADLGASPAAPGTGSRVTYGEGAEAFAGATYDPTSHYRAAAVFAFHRAHGLDPQRLRAISTRQMQILKSEVERLDLDPAVAHVVPMPDERRAGFLAIRTPHAARVARQLGLQGVHADTRADILRLGPAPYVADRQLWDAVATLGASFSRPE